LRECGTFPAVEHRWLSPEQQRAWRRFIAAVQLLPHDLDHDMRKSFDLSMHEYWVLAMLSEHEDRSMRMQELARRSTSTASRLSHTISRLIERGLVVKEREGQDKRGQRAILTDAGFDLIVKAAPRHADMVLQLIFDSLTDEQVAQMSQIFDQVLERLDPSGERSPGGRI